MITEFTVGAFARLQGETLLIPNFCVSRQHRPGPIVTFFRNYIFRLWNGLFFLWQSKQILSLFRWYVIHNRRKSHFGKLRHWVGDEYEQQQAHSSLTAAHSSQETCTRLEQTSPSESRVRGGKYGAQRNCWCSHNKWHIWKSRTSSLTHLVTHRFKIRRNLHMIGGTSLTSCCNQSRHNYDVTQVNSVNKGS